MPELPEVETMRRGILGSIGGTILNVTKPKSKYRPIVIGPDWRTFQQRCTGSRVEDVRRIGKRVLIDLDNQSSIVMQPKMAGLVVVSNPPTVAHVRLQIELTNCQTQEIIYWDKRGLGSVHLWTPEEVEEHLGEGRVGIDALQITVDQMIDRFGALKRPVKPALLDQALVAGVGNLYASELLHEAKVHPELHCCELSKPQWRRIHAAMLRILLEAIDQEGSTLGDGTYRNSVSDPGSYQAQHRVYARDGELCLICRKQKIVRTVQSQRSTFHCPRCQKR